MQISLSSLLLLTTAVAYWLSAATQLAAAVQQISPGATYCVWGALFFGAVVVVLGAAATYDR